MTAFSVQRRVVSLNENDVSEVRTASIIGAQRMEAVCISETLVYFNVIIRRYIPKSCHLQIVLLFNTKKFLSRQF
jgi:hypothetical protein